MTRGQLIALATAIAATKILPAAQAAEVRAGSVPFAAASEPIEVVEFWIGRRFVESAIDAAPGSQYERMFADKRIESQYDYASRMYYFRSTAEVWHEYFGTAGEDEA